MKDKGGGGSTARRCGDPPPTANWRESHPASTACRRWMSTNASTRAASALAQLAGPDVAVSTATSPVQRRRCRLLAIDSKPAVTLELKMLAFSIVLGLIQIVLAAHAASLQRGYVWTASSRDEAVPALTGVAGRLQRSLQNFIETFPLFAAAVLTAHVAATHSWMTEWGVQLYFWARVAYLALYAAGVFLLRSLVWNVAVLGIVLVLLSLV